MSVARICNRTVVTVSPTERVRAAARRMAEHDVGTLVAVDEQGVPTGILTDRDIAIRLVGPGLDPDATPVARILSMPIHTVREETPIDEALSKMAGAGVRRVAVTDQDDKLVGILALDDVLELLIEEAEAIGRLLASPAPTVQGSR